MTLFYNFQLVDADFTHFIPHQSMLVQQGRIKWIGSKEQYKEQQPCIKGTVKKVNLKNQKILPSFIECHTHTLFAGSRADEFEKRNSGVSYLEIAAQGGGILSTVKKTRQAKASELQKTGQERINHYLKQGVSTVEIKSGYGLDLENEVKLLEVAKKLKGPRIITTYLGAHAKPTEFDTYENYLNFILNKILPVLKKKKLTSRVDIFIEKGFFEASAAQKYLEKFKSEGFAVTIHANQLSNSGGAALALELKAHSADHVIHLSQKDIQDFAQSNTVAVLLPAADLYMKCEYPPARQLIDAGASVALATDFNPGSCPTQDLMLVGLLARLEMKMSLSEVFKAYTLNAAKALGIATEEGSLEAGKYANFICTQAELSDFFYSVGNTPKHQLYIRGKKVN